MESGIFKLGWRQQSLLMSKLSQKNFQMSTMFCFDQASTVSIISDDGGKMRFYSGRES